MICLVLDTSNNFCSVGVYDAEQNVLLGEISEDLGRGHAERLIPSITECLDLAAIGLIDVDRVISTIGPGSFTGVRVGLATARGLGLGLNVPVVGVSNLLALESFALGDASDTPLLTAMDAKRGDLFVRYSVFNNNGNAIEAELVSLASIAETLDGEKFIACGSGAPMLAERMKRGNGMTILHTLVSPPVLTVGKLGAQMPIPPNLPEPLYLRKPDAKSQSGFAVALKS